MNPFVYAVREPVAAFADLAVLSLFLAALIVVAYGLTGNVIALYDDWDTGGWDVNPPVGWVLRLAAVPASIAIAAWLVSAMFAMLG